MVPAVPVLEAVAGCEPEALALPVGPATPALPVGPVGPPDGPVGPVGPPAVTLEPLTTRESVSMPWRTIIPLLNLSERAKEVMDGLSKDWGI